jgi:leader peptidase (prepilin peptidase)/N-methyltransferase
VLKKDAMGFGDVKLLAGYGALMGVTGAVETLLVAALLGIVVMVPYGMLAAKKAAQNKNSEEAGQIPFGPFLAIAAPVIYLWGPALVDAYFKYVLGE